MKKVYFSIQKLFHSNQRRQKEILNNSPMDQSISFIKISDTLCYLYHGQFYYYIRSQFWRSNYYYSRSYKSQSSIHLGFQKVSLLSYLNSTLLSTLLLRFLLFAADILFLSLIASVSRNSFSNSLLAYLITLRLNLLIKLILLGDMDGTLVLAFFFLFFLFFLICFILIM